MMYLQQDSGEYIAPRPACCELSPAQHPISASQLQKLGLARGFLAKGKCFITYNSATKPSVSRRTVYFKLKKSYNSGRIQPSHSTDIGFPTGEGPPRGKGCAL